MKQNLDTLKTEILQYLESEGFAIFYGLSHGTEDHPTVHWDAARHPNYRMFLAAAKTVGARLVTFHCREFTSPAVDDAFDQLEECDLTPEERLSLERRLRDLRAFEGFTCVIELSFDYQGRVYLYDLHTDWYMDFLDLLDEIDAYVPEDEEEDEGPLSGYFSNN